MEWDVYYGTAPPSQGRIMPFSASASLYAENAHITMKNRNPNNPNVFIKNTQTQFLPTTP